MTEFLQNLSIMFIVLCVVVSSLIHVTRELSPVFDWLDERLIVARMWWTRRRG